MMRASDTEITRQLGVVGECDARTQGAPIVVLLGRLRTKQRAAQRVPATQGFTLIRVLLAALVLAGAMALAANAGVTTAPAAPAARTLLAVGDIASCASDGDEQTAA